MINNFLQYKIKLTLVLLVLVNVFACSLGGNQDYTKPTYNQYQQQRYSQTPQGQDSYYYPPQTQYYGSPYQYQQPASRYYNNPYGAAPQNQNPYYDGDQYYVPPTYYGSTNRDNVPTAVNQKF